MDLSVLPTLCGLTVFVLCFRPLVRRVGAHTNIWFVGWGFLLIHYLLKLLPARPGGWQQTSDFLCTGATELCGLCFVFAASNISFTPTGRLLAAEIAVPLLLQSALAQSSGVPLGLRLAVDLLMLGPVAHLLLLSRERARPFLHVAVVFGALVPATLIFVREDQDLVVNVLLCIIFLGAAYLVSAFAPRLTRGVGLMALGLVLWALSYPLQSASWLHLDARVMHPLLDLPRYLVAGGMILSLLDEYLNRAESLALHDPLTGLPNRRLFDVRLDQAMRESQLTQTPIACLVIDVDKFKYINDTFGHPVGDGLLQALAKRLSWNLGPRDMLARTGGDEFTAILVEAADEHHVRFIAGAMMAAGCVPVSIQQHLIDVRISIGIAVAPQDAIENAELHRVADEAMYRAKRSGGGGVSFAHEEMEQVHAV